jgi:N-acetylmuramoyl-L-alanine amidase
MGGAIYYTEMILEEALAKFCNLLANVNSHYVIKADVEILQLVNDKNVAWHAGESYWYDFDKLNNYSIGIELDNMVYNPYSLEQMTSCEDLCKELTLIHNIPQKNVIGPSVGHSDIAPHRKIDPGPFFNWSYLAVHNLGKWHNINNTQLNQPIIFNYNEGKAHQKYYTCKTS